MDWGFLIGLLATGVLLAWTLVAGGRVTLYWNVPSFFLVVGATITLLMVVTPLRNLRAFGSLLKRAVLDDQPPCEDLIEKLVGYSETARRHGILSLEEVTKREQDPFLVHAVQMAVDGADPEVIRYILTTEINNLSERHEHGRGMFDSIAKYAPALGMIGTLIGLVVMLKNADDPKMIGPGMAIAILTTLYGALIAYAFAPPMSDRLARRPAEEVLRKSSILEGMVAIQSGDIPRIVEQKLRTFLPPTARERMFGFRPVKTEAATQEKAA